MHFGELKAKEDNILTISCLRQIQILSRDSLEELKTSLETKVLVFKYGRIFLIIRMIRTSSKLM